MSRFDEEPDGDPHGECAAEIARLREEAANALDAKDAEIAALQKQVSEWLAANAPGGWIDILRNPAPYRPSLHPFHYE